MLFPGGRLPLKIFEPRYVRLMKECIRDGTPFGVCLIKDGDEVGDTAVTETLGCSATIAHWDMPSMGLFHIVSVGERVFQLQSAAVEGDGLIRGQVTYLDAAPDAIVPEELEGCREVLRQIIERVGASHFPTPIRLDDADWVSYRLGELLPVGSELKQQLLCTRDPVDRLSLIDRLLEASSQGA